VKQNQFASGVSTSRPFNAGDLQSQSFQPQPEPSAPRPGVGIVAVINRSVERAFSEVPLLHVFFAKEDRIAQTVADLLRRNTLAYQLEGAR